MHRGIALTAACLLAPIVAAACGTPNSESLSQGPGGSGMGGTATGLPTSDLDGGGAAGEGSSGPTLEDVFNALEPALYSACGTCHGQAGNAAGAPPWLAGPNRYTTIKAYPGIIVTDVESSLLLTIGDTVQHAGGPGLNDSPPAHLLDAVTAWLVLESETLQAVPLAATSPFVLQAGPNKIDISKGGVSGASMSFTAQLQGATLTFTDMTITAPASTGLEIVHPIFAIVPPSGGIVPDVSDAFSNLDQTVPAGTTMPLGVGVFVFDVAASMGSNWASKDQLEIEFTSLSKTTAGGGDGGTSTEGGGGGCKSVSTFTADAVPAIQANTCLTCHQGQNASATANLDMTQVGTDDTAACAQALTRVNLSNPSQSEIILAPTGGISNHPFQGASANFTTMMLEWIDKE